MPSLTRTIATDVCVVGAGLLGLAHALEARRRGLSVVMLERGERLSGASVRDSGHLFFSALAAGAGLEAAELARERWLEITQRAGVTAQAGGTLILARYPEELALMEAAAADPRRAARMRSAKRAGRLAPIDSEGLLGAFHGTADMRIGPRSTPAALARLLARDPAVRIEWGTHVHAVEPGVVRAGELCVNAAAIVVCPGADRRNIPADLWPKLPEVTLRRTQMLKLEAPAARRYGATLGTGMTLLDYPAFRLLEGYPALAQRLELETPELVERSAGPLVTQLAQGALIVAGTSQYGKSLGLRSREQDDDLILAQLRGLLGITPRVRQRWTVVTLRREQQADDFVTTNPMPGVRLVQALGATAAASCHVHASTVLDHLLSEPGADGYINVRDCRLRRPHRARTGLSAHAQAFSGPVSEHEG